MSNSQRNLIHYIGHESLFDDDMELIESFVECHNNRDDFNIQSKVYHYYVSRIKDYWNVFLSGLNNNEILTNTYLPLLNVFEQIQETIQNNTLYHIFNGLMWFNKSQMYGEGYNIMVQRLKSRCELYDVTPEHIVDEVKIYLSSKLLPSLEDVCQAIFPLDDNYNIIETPNYDEQPRFLVQLTSSDYHVYYRANSLLTFEKDAKQFIVDNINYYETKFNQFMDASNDFFNETRVLNMEHIMYMYKYICTLLCYDPRIPLFTNKYLTSVSFDKIYILPNDTGIFGLNTFLYAYYEGIYLIGAPSGISHVDGEDVCPHGFLNHDLQHTAGFTDLYSRDSQEINAFNPGKEQLFIITRKVYYSILNSDINYRIKEWLITYIWILLHEISTDIYSYVNVDGSFNEKQIMVTLISMFGFPFIHEFKELFISYIRDVQLIQFFEGTTSKPIDTDKILGNYENPYLSIELVSDNIDYIVFMYTAAKYIHNSFQYPIYKLLFSSS